jgi:YD repeat-containing protein
MHPLPKVLAAIALPLLTIGGIQYAGPLRSGALLLLYQLPDFPRKHDIPPSYDPEHRGFVDSGTGLYIRHDEDLVLRSTPGFVLQRTYHSQDTVSRAFGVGSTHNGERYLRGNPSDLKWVELILEDATRVRFERISPGTAVSNALFEHRGDAAFPGARVGWAAMFWAMRLDTGPLMLFRSCRTTGSDTCSIIKLLDADGHLTHFRRDKAGILREIAAGGETISFEYDDKGRITQAKDSSGRLAEYGYDERGYLASVKTSEGVIRKYTYNADGQMATIDEPGWFIQNFYEHKRCVLQHTDVRSDDGTVERFTFRWNYVLRGDRIVATEVTKPDGTTKRYEFDE